MRNSATLALARAAAGLPVDGAALPPRVASAVAVATELGAPLVPVLEAALQVEAGRRDLLRAVEVATAEGRAVARGLVLAPPIVGPLTAVLVTDAPLAVWATPVGRMVLALAVGLGEAAGADQRRSLFVGVGFVRHGAWPPRVRGASRARRGRWRSRGRGP